MVHSRSRVAWSLVAGAAGVACIAVSACSSSFSGCESSRDCDTLAGGGGDSGGADADARAGSSSEISLLGGASGAQGNAGAAGAAAGEASGGENSGGGSAGEAGAAGAAGNTSEVGGTGGSAPVDTTPPTILSITPVNGATNLTTATDTIVVTFNEPMNQAATDAAFVPNAAAPAPTFSWNAAGTVLKINPNLPYPSATDPNAAATPFVFSLTTAAKDLAGNSVAASVSWQFTLLRELTQSLPYAGGGNLTPGANSAASFPLAGDTVTNLEYRGFMSYDLSLVPDKITTIESATINTHLAGIWGDPFGSLGNMLIQSVSYSKIDQTTFDIAPLHDLGVFIAATGTNTVGDTVSKDVLVAFKDDYANRVERQNSSQYRLLFSGSPNSNDTSDAAYVERLSTNNTLTVKYLFP